MEEEVKVSELPMATNVDDDDLVMVVQDGFNKQVTKENFQKEKVNKSGDTMTGQLNMQSNPIAFGSDGNIYWKEDGYGDKFRLIPYFGGEGSNNVLRVQSTTGGAGTDPTNWKDLINVHADTGEMALPNNAFVPKYFQMVWGNSLTVATEVGGHGLILCSNSAIYMFWIAGGNHDQLSANLIWGNDMCNITMSDSEHINISTKNNDSMTCSVLFFRNP